jgi:hypothetical protein
LVKAAGHRELSSAQSVGAGLEGRGVCRLDFGNGLFAAKDEKGFPMLDA